MTAEEKKRKRVSVGNQRVLNEFNSRSVTDAKAPPPEECSSTSEHRRRSGFVLFSEDRLFEPCCRPCSDLSVLNRM